MSIKECPRCGQSELSPVHVIDCDTTPAPLDPHAIKPGHTVTVRFIATGDEITTKAYRPDDVKAPWVYLLGWPLIKGYDAGDGGTLGLAVKHFEILDHQPAPEPEPEWEPGAIANATVNGTPNVRVMRTDGGLDQVPEWFTPVSIPYNGEGNDRWYHSDDVVTDVRPLVVIDRAEVDADALIEDAIKSAQRKGYWPDTVVGGHMIRHALAALGIEVSS